MYNKPQYPQYLEAFWTQQAQDVLGPRSLTALREHVWALSTQFTAERPEHFSNYHRSAWTLLAYGLYFFPQSWVRLRYPLQELFEFRGWQPKLSGSAQGLKILDLGAGLGATGLSALAYLSGRGYAHVQLHAVDHSAQALEALEKLHRACYDTFWPGSQLKIYRESMLRVGPEHPRLGKESFDLIILGFSLNESHAQAEFDDKLFFLKHLTQLLSPSGILLILEPALKETSEALQRLSAELIQKSNLFSWGPYLHQGPCPLLSKGDVWTHEVRTWRIPQKLQQLGTPLFKVLHELKFSFSALGKRGAPALSEMGHTLRLVAPPYETKSVYLLKGVAQDGQIHSYELQRRDAPRARMAFLKHLERGDFVHIPVFKTLPGHEHFRLQAPEDIILLTP